MKRKQKIIIFLLVFFGLSQLMSGFYIKLKANVANWLINETWHTRFESSEPQKPWPWADTKVVGWLNIPRLNVSQPIMHDMSGESLAFGVGVSDTLSAAGYNILAGHRDTHFQFLDQLQMGDIVRVETYAGEVITYSITHSEIIDIRSGPLIYDSSHEGLSLVTCWPMNAVVPGGPLRYILSAKRLKSTDYPNGVDDRNLRRI